MGWVDLIKYSVEGREFGILSSIILFLLIFLKNQALIFVMETVILQTKKPTFQKCRGG